jgi:hypothetical protein
MKLGISKDSLETALYSLPAGLTIGFLYPRLTMVHILVSLGVGLVAAAAGCSFLVSNLLLSLTLILMVNYYVREGFNTRTPSTEIAATLRNMKANNPSQEEGFLGSVYQNITKAGYNSPGFGMAGPLVEGFEDDEKSKKNGNPAPTEKMEEDKKVKDSKPPEKKDMLKELPAQFKLGEIPSQVKNGPHIDAGSTLIKAIQGLNPDQINAMNKDTQQLIETQKSLMNMLGTMKPMMNDGKELMETFQQMFGQQATP